MLENNIHWTPRHLDSMSIDATCYPRLTVHHLQMVEEGKCNNDCMFARDGTCDDRRSTGACPDGTDCEDCGPWGQTNFTMVRGTDRHTRTDGDVAEAKVAPPEEEG